MRFKLASVKKMKRVFILSHGNWRDHYFRLLSLLLISYLVVIQFRGKGKEIIPQPQGMIIEIKGNIPISMVKTEKEMFRCKKSSFLLLRPPLLLHVRMQSSIVGATARKPRAVSSFVYICSEWREKIISFH